ncbi:universal stress protein [Loigolactobacillus jiayinensis]|uniref:Universal stress protein n=1 Tax=Loigolactobacillus jiayinensis TaxID=2486016 RepID=A0ABW1REZ6_9LACO|nr:universal stress protein [Loigolactobacillus jiayinensis]
MYQHILVPLDGSRNAEVALQEALELAQKYGSELFVASIVDEQHFVAYGYGMTVPMDFYSDMKDRSQQILAEAEKRASALGIKTTTILANGNPKKAIAEELPEKYDIDLIVMGKSGVDALSRIMLGSTTSYVVHHSTTKVLVVNDEDDDTEDDVTEEE